MAKSCSVVLFLFSVLMVLSGGLHAQGVYVTRGDKGPVFSDKPQPGAKEVTLKPLNVVKPPPQPGPKSSGMIKKENGPSAGQNAEHYREFTVRSPQNDGSVLASTAVFEVRLAIEPPLKLGAGHAFTVSINGQPVGRRFTTEEFMIPPEFWGDQLPPANQSLQLDAQIVDGDGMVLKQAAPVRFFMRHANIQNRPPRFPHRPDFPREPPAPKPRAMPNFQPGTATPSGRDVQTQPRRNSAVGTASKMDQ